MPGETEEQVLTRLQNAVHGLDNVSVQFDQLTQQCYTGNTLSTLDFVAGWHAIGENVWQARILAELQDAGLSTKTFAAPYGTNASTSAGIRGIPTVIFGPGSIEQAHTVDEWIAIDELLMSKRAYAAIIKACLGI
jgi:acetylornithine deacetylase/succinyl-diaminopimelate desuccinylase-like protein